MRAKATVLELSIVGDDSVTIFTRGDRYVIPLYQRGYAWGEEHIERLIEDVSDLAAEGSQKYYLGSLVVSPRGNALYEVIDGQQRLTTLYLLLFALGYLRDARLADAQPALSFSCREKSDYTLSHLARLAESGEVAEQLVEPSIAAGLRVILDRLKTSYDGDGREALKAKLSKTCLYRIEVPAHTDLNHYFEVMNTRGEQLEQHEVCKARLMEPLARGDASRFACIWDACSDMSCYVQMRFEKAQRKHLFGADYNEFPSAEAIQSLAWDAEDGASALSIREIVAAEAQGANAAGGEDDGPSRFESVIDFRFFLLHALKVFVRTRAIVSMDGKALVERSLDDKKLTAAFERVAKQGWRDGRPIDRAWFSTEFARCLLQTRFLFDTRIIKREFRDGNPEGAWSLKSLRRGERGVRYVGSAFGRGNDQQGGALGQANKTALMLQACLRVSYTSPKDMHWITSLLCALMEDQALASSEAYLSCIEGCAKRAAASFLASGNFSLGLDTPHVVLNYLDYLLWVRDGRRDDFAFEFRTSVEHWYPQNPSNNTFAKWDEVDRFGNLCLLQRNVNARFSNLDPVAKRSTHEKRIAKGSLKLREMARLTKDANDWKGGTCQEHERAMLQLLRDACNFERRARRGCEGGHRPA